jgi:hypothetical protein
MSARRRISCSAMAIFSSEESLGRPIPNIVADYSVDEETEICVVR